MSGRDAILRAVRASVRHAAPHPGPHPAPPLEAGFARFAAVLASVGGSAHGPLPARDFAAAVLAHARAEAAGGRIVAAPSAAALLGDGSLEVARPDADPRSFADVAVAIACGQVGVAENAAVAVASDDAPQRSLLFLAERVILLLGAGAIDADLHTALRRVGAAVRPGAHLTWISGPSKTADIEQALVYGAHGPRALAVFAYEGG